MTEQKPTAAEQFAAFFNQALPLRDLNALFNDTDDTEENDK